MSERVRAGAIVGASLSAVLAAALSVGWRAARLPFPPFDLFDELARVLPGSIVTLWIDGAVLMLRAAGAASMDTAAKHAEQTISIASFLLAGAAIGGAVFATLALSSEPAALFGALLGIALGIGIIGVERSLDRLPPGVDLDSVWVMGTCIAWGFALGALHDRWRASDDQTNGTGRRASGHSIDRRRFLTRVAWMTAVSSSVAAVCATVIGRSRSALGARWSDTHALPNADAPVTPLPGTRPELTPIERHYRIDIDTRPPQIDAAAWRLKIAGLVDHPLALTLDDLRRAPSVDQFITLSCISNPVGGDLIGTQRWTGVSLARVLQDAAPQPAATHAKMTSVDGFFDVVSLSLATADPRVMLAYAWDGVPLAQDHGFPLRIYIPDVYGMKQPKWMSGIELVNKWEPGYWVERGWDREARMLETAIVDTATFDSKRAIVAAGGIAHAGARGVSRVDVRLDEQGWTPASLRDPLSRTTWVIWRAEIPATQAPNRLSVRCADGQGTLQREPFHTVRVRRS